VETAILGGVFAILAAVIGSYWASASERRRMHQDNMKVWIEHLRDHENYPLHDHPEKAGPLLAENIRYPRN
jgi:hypothetical protein